MLLSADTLNPHHYRTDTDRARPPLSRRALSLLLALAIEALLILAFLGLDFRDKAPPQFKGGAISVFDLANDQDRSANKAQKSQPAAARPQPTRPVVPKIPPKLKTVAPPMDLVEMTKEELASADIAKLGSNAPDAGGAKGGGHAPGDSPMVGTAPNGEPLYAAEWYREPTDQELSTYLPKRMPEGGGWGTVACKTAERYKVIDCVEIDNNPPGSHLAGAVRQAAWQFLVRPPRVGGKPLVGEWVRIRIYYGMEMPKS